MVMSTKNQSEEQFPLLLFLVGDEDNSKNNKRFSNRNRFDGITSGASAVITEWPKKRKNDSTAILIDPTDSPDESKARRLKNYISSCWVTTLICGITLFMTSLLLTSCMSFQSSHRLPRCASTPITDLLTNTTTIHLAHDSRPWTQKQLDLLENITATFPNFTIHITVIKTHTSLFRQSQKRQAQLFNAFLKSNRTRNPSGASAANIDDFVGRHANVVLSYKNYDDIFDRTPLFISWVVMTEPMRIFAIRVLQLWQFGGVSYDLTRFTTSALRYNYKITNHTTQTIEKQSLVQLISEGPKQFAQLKDEKVSVDEEGLHMATRTPCHAFFGKVLMRMRKASAKMTPRTMLKGAMLTFCKTATVQQEYCDNRHFI